MEKRTLLPLNLQFFAEEVTPPVEPEVPEEKQTEEKTYTQADIDRIVGERLAREKAKSQKQIEDAKAEAERKKLEEANEFKALYEAEKERVAKIEAEVAAERLSAKKQRLLIEAGYASDKLPDLYELVTGKDEEEVKASIERLVRVAPPKAAPVDPSVSGGGRTNSQALNQVDASYEAAREKARKLLKRK